MSLAPRLFTPRKMREAKLAALAAAAIEYAEQSSGGPDPLTAGARLRIAAKEYAAAERSVSAQPIGRIGQ